MATGRPVAKTLIKYKSNSLKENDEKEKKPINIELTEKDLYNDENAVEFRWSDEKRRRRGRYCFG